ncbi:hypothetical protein SEA_WILLIAMBOONE_191 [Gordonia phage WilliamBoone]|nr:hypothetical protein SEA_WILLIAMBOONE_191 [Gordonia phage WilliamBoone]
MQAYTLIFHETMVAIDAENDELAIDRATSIAGTCRGIALIREADDQDIMPEWRAEVISIVMARGRYQGPVCAVDCEHGSCADGFADRVNV